MRIIYQLVERDTGKRSEPMAAETSELQKILSDCVVEDEREKYYLLVLMEEREMEDQDGMTDNRMVWSACPLILLSTYINLGASENAA